jgi:hypothetical protein
MNVLGMDGMAYLASDDFEERRLMEHLLEATLEKAKLLQKSLAVQIANSLGKMFK